MDYWITTEPEYLRARLVGRETVEETQEFVRAVALENSTRRRAAILCDIRLSRPIFHVEPREFFDCFRKLAGDSSSRIALLGDTPELRLSNEYLAFLAQQRGLNVVSFPGEAAALKWLTGRQQGQERRRHQPERRQSGAQLIMSERRWQRERRLHPA